MDKDIIIKGNKTYEPNACCIIPERINNIFTKSDAIRGSCAIGVSWIERDCVFRAQCNDGYKNKVSLGDYSREIDAFNAYKRYKESVIKRVAKEFKGKIPDKVYCAMMEYEVDIND